MSTVGMEVNEGKTGVVDGVLKGRYDGILGRRDNGNAGDGTEDGVRTAGPPIHEDEAARGAAVNGIL